MKSKKEVIGYCVYCKEPIYRQDIYMVVDGDKYHMGCFKTSNTYNDPYGFEE